MKTLEQQLSNYAAYHRDPRNVVTHFVGIPLIVLSVEAILSRPTWSVGPFAISPAVIAMVAACSYYIRLDRLYGIALTLVLSLGLWVGAWLALLSTAGWLGASIGLFVVGWAIQFLGHYFEGRKPAFVDDIMGLLIGPLFVLAEVGFAMGIRPELRERISGREAAATASHPAE